MEEPKSGGSEVLGRVTDPYALATLLLFFACTLNFFAAALDTMGIISVWDPGPATELLILLGAAFVLQAGAAFQAIRFYRTGVSRLRNLGGLLSLATLAVLTLSLILNGGNGRG